MNLVIRKAAVSDAERFAHIGAATFAMACPPATPLADVQAYIRSELTVDRFQAYIADADKSLYAAEADGTVVGYLMLCRGEPPATVAGKAPLELRRLYVLEPFHGTGIAAGLMSTAVYEAVSGGHDALWLAVSKHNPRATAFYRKHGFAVVGEQPFRVGDDVHEDFIMRRTTSKSG